MTERFKFTPVGDFAAGKTKITERDLERAYRRGYSQGYYVAANDAGSNNHEALLAHADALYWQWRVAYDQRRESEHLPPAIGTLKTGGR